MKRRTFLEVALLAGAGLLGGVGSGLAWSRREGFPGLRVDLLRALDLDGVAHRLVVVDRADPAGRALLDVPWGQVPSRWRVPALRRGPADAVHELEARALDGQGRLLARTEPPLTVRFRAFRFSV